MRTFPQTAGWMGDDGDLLEAWGHGDESAASALLARYYPAVLRFFDLRSPRAAEDLTQKTFLGCIEGRERVRSAASFRAFLFGIACNVLRKHLRSKTDESGVFGTGDVSSSADPGQTASRIVALHQEQHLLLRALQLLDTDTQTLIALHYWEEMTTREISAVLGVGVSTLTTRLSRARKLLRETIPRSPRGAAVSRLAARRPGAVGRFDRRPGDRTRALTALRQGVSKAGEQSAGLSGVWHPGDAGDRGVDRCGELLGETIERIAPSPTRSSSLGDRGPRFAPARQLPRQRGVSRLVARDLGQHLTNDRIGRTLRLGVSHQRAVGFADAALGRIVGQHRAKGPRASAFHPRRPRMSAVASGQSRGGAGMSDLVSQPRTVHLGAAVPGGRGRSAREPGRRRHAPRRPRVARRRRRTVRTG